MERNDLAGSSIAMMIGMAAALRTASRSHAQATQQAVNLVELVQEGAAAQTTTQPRKSAQVEERNLEETRTTPRPLRMFNRT